jgi:hypothetical protein
VVDIFGSTSSKAHSVLEKKTGKTLCSTYVQVNRKMKDKKEILELSHLVGNNRETKRHYCHQNVQPCEIRQSQQDHCSTNLIQIIKVLAKELMTYLSLKG